MFGVSSLFKRTMFSDTTPLETGKDTGFKLKQFDDLSQESGTGTEMLASVCGWSSDE